MPDNSNRPKAPRPPRRKEADYEVGYGKPPHETRFKPGKSGNPNGRPKGAKNKKSDIPAKNEERLKQVFIEECYREIGVRDGEKLVKMPVIQAVVRNLALNAAKGNQRAQRMLTDSLRSVERENKAEAEEHLKTMIEYKIEGEQILAQREEKGITGPRPYPHPDDIHFNIVTGEVEIRGPITPDEDEYVKTFTLKVTMEAQIAKAKDDLADRPNSKAKKKQLERLRLILAKIEADLENHPGGARFEGIKLPPQT